MKKKAIHHTPSREYSHAWGELKKSRQDLPGNTLADHSSSSEDFPLEQLSTLESQNRKPGVRHFFSLTRPGNTEREYDPVIAENEPPPISGNLESRLYHLQDLLSDYRWIAETEIIDRTSDASVHLDQMANDYRASVRAELEKFRDETGDSSLLRRSLVDSALRRLSGGSDDTDQRHHNLPTENQDSSSPKEFPVFFNYFPRSERKK